MFAVQVMLEDGSGCDYTSMPAGAVVQMLGRLDVERLERLSVERQGSVRLDRETALALIELGYLGLMQGENPAGERAVEELKRLVGE